MAPEVAPSDLVEYFALDVGDLRWVRSYQGAATRLGLGVQLCALRFLGFVPADLASTPVEVAPPGGAALRGGLGRGFPPLRRRRLLPDPA